MMQSLWGNAIHDDPTGAICGILLCSMAGSAGAAFNEVFRLVLIWNTTSACL